MHTDNQNFNMDTTNTQPNQTTAIDQRITGGDPDVDALQAEFGGEEAVGGTAPTPDQDQVEEIAIAAGVPLADKQPGCPSLGTRSRFRRGRTVSLDREPVKPKVLSRSGNS